MAERQRIAAYGILLNEEGRVLLARAAPSLTLQGRWFLPGGGVQHGEHPLDSLVREIAEESGLQVEVGPLLDVLSDVRTLPDATSLHTIRLIYRIAQWSGGLRPEVDGTTDAIRWFAPEELSDIPLAHYVELALGGRSVNQPEDTRHHVVIIGAGFGGLFAAKALRRARVRVTLIDRANHHLFQPLLYQVATGILSEGQIAPPIRDIFRYYASMEVVLADVETIDPHARTLTAREFGRPINIPYDSLIVAAGAVTSYFGHDEFKKDAWGMKSLDDAMHLRNQIYGAFEQAEAETDEKRQAELMSFVVIGGGPTGVEMAGQLKELSRRALRSNYRHIDPSATKVHLVEGGDHLLATMGPRISKMAERDMRRLGVDVHLGSMVTGMDEHSVELSDHDGSTKTLVAATRVWAAGTRGAPLGAVLAEATGATLTRSGQVEVEPDCTVPGFADVFVVGDLMSLNGLPGVAEVAIQSGAHCGHTIKRRVNGNSVARAFKYHDLGTMAAISRFRAVAKVGPLKVGGLLGWLLWLVVHLAFLTGFKNRFGALGRWAISFVGRGRAERALTGRWTTGEDPSGDSS